MCGRLHRIDPAERGHLGERLPHADHAGAAAGGIDDPVGQRPVELLRQLVAHRLLAFDAVRLLERRHVVPAAGLAELGGHLAGVGDQAVDERDLRAVQLALADERRLHVARHEDVRFNARALRRRRPSRFPRCPPWESTARPRPGECARVTAADRPRALNEFVGLSDSSLTYSSVEAERRAEPPGVRSAASSPRRA